MVPAVQGGPNAGLPGGMSSVGDAAGMTAGGAPDGSYGSDGFGSAMTEAFSGLPQSGPRNGAGGTSSSAAAPVEASGKSAQQGVDAGKAAAPSPESMGNGEVTAQTVGEASQGSQNGTGKSPDAKTGDPAKGGGSSAEAVLASGAAGETVDPSGQALTGAQLLAAAQENATTKDTNLENAGTASVEGATASASDAGGSKAGATGASGMSTHGSASAKSDPKKVDGKAQAGAPVAVLANGLTFVAAAAAPVVAQPGAAPSARSTAAQAASSNARAEAAIGAGSGRAKIAIATGGTSPQAGKSAGVAGAASGNVMGGTSSRSAPGVDGVSGGSASDAAKQVSEQVAAPQGVSANSLTANAHSATRGTGLSLPVERNGKEATAGTTGAAGGGFTATLLQAGAGMSPSTAAQTGSQHVAGNAGGAGAANPYTRMDGAQQATLTYASPQKMTVTVSDPSLGSFEVRAQSAGSQVAASLATMSAATHAQLSGHLPSLTAFLQEQRVDVSRVTVVQQGLLGGDAGARGFGGQQGRGGSGGQRGRSQSARVGAAGSVDAAVGVSGAAGVDGVSGVAMSSRGMATMPAASESARSESSRVDVLA